MRWRTFKCKLCGDTQRVNSPEDEGFEIFSTYMSKSFGWAWSKEYGWLCQKCNVSLSETKGD